MIDVKKVRMMTKLSMYEEQIGKRDLRMHRYSRKNYVWIRMFTCFLAVTAAYILAAGLYLMRFYTTILNDAAAFSYGRVILAVLIPYLIIIVLCLLFTASYENKRYRAMMDRIRQYDAELAALKNYMDQEEQSSRTS